MYANFVGTWTGFDHHQKDGVWIDEDVDLNISSNKRGMRFDYAYGTKGKRGYDRLTRYVTLLPEKSEAIFQWEGEKKETYSASELAEFAQTGFGTFSFITMWSDSGFQTPHRCTFTLDRNFLTYKWEAAQNGTPFKLTAIWQLHRKVTSAFPATP